MHKMSSTNENTSLSRSPSIERRKVYRKTPKKRFRKSKTPPSRKSMDYSHSSGSEDSDDDFPKYRENWDEKSPISPKAQLKHVKDELTTLYDLLDEDRDIVKGLIR